MKLLLTLLISFIAILNLSAATYPVCPAPSSVPSGCASADPFCTGTTYTFPNSTNLGNQGSLECLGSTPNPTWYYLEIATAGNIDIQINQVNTAGNGIDVDFALLGPYTSVAAGCANPASGCVEDCSFSTAASETANIAGAQVGEIYLLLLTNFSNQPGTITFNQTGGSGATDCSILAPCSISAMTANPGPCNPANNQYNVSGSISFANPPASGNLTVTSSCGGSQTFNAPFNSPINYNLTGLTSNGTSCTITAVFSDDAACTFNQNYTSPQPCTTSPCFMSFIGVSSGYCDGATNTFNLSNGQFDGITFSDPPGSGTLVIETVIGGQTYDTIINPPFVSPQDWSISGLPANGESYIVTAYFTADTGCSLSSDPLTAPMDCSCSAEIGTFTASITGSSNTNYVLCFGDEIDIIANGDYTPPGEAIDPPNAGGYEPGITWLVYTCPPSVALTPSLTEDVPDDPCLLGIFSDFDLNDVNDMSWINGFPAGTFTNNTVYFVPITMYNLTEGLYSYVNTDLPCYELGTPYAVQYLPQITSTQSQTCTNVTATISGGLPAVNGSQFTAVAGSLTPANATFVNTAASNGGTIAITGLTAGQGYSFQVQDANGCPITVTGTFTGEPTLSYPQTAYCSVGTASPTITGTAGGTYTSTAGLSINTTTGVINLGTSTPGTYTVTYTTPAVPGPACTATFIVTVHPLPTILANDVTVCQGGTVNVTASGADTYSWSPGTFLSATTGATVSFSNGVTSNYTITGTNVNGCVNTAFVTVTVNENAPINAGPDQTVCIGESVTLTASGASTYTWTGNVQNGISFNPPVGTITYTVTGTSAEGCTSSDQVVVLVNPLPNVFAGNDITVCEGETVTLTGSGAATYSWTGNINNGIAFVPSLGTTTYTVTGTSSAGCVNTDQVNVVVNPIPAVAFTPGAIAGCAPFTTTLTNTTSGVSNCVWTISNGTTITGCGTVPVTFTQAGCFDVTLTTTSAEGCSSSMTANDLICVEAPPIASFEPSANQLSNLNTAIEFINTTTGATSYVWDFGDGSLTSADENPSHVYPVDPVGNYNVMLIAYSPLGCTDTAYSLIQIYEELIFYVPNTFTPDNDTYNPEFKPVFTSGFDPFDYTLLIFNRWGELIFESHNAEVGWDGSYGSNGEIEMCQDGTYTWKIEFKVTRWDERRMVVGHVNLIR